MRRQPKRPRTMTAQERFQLFVTRSDKLFATKFARKKKSASLVLSSDWQLGQSITLEKAPDDETLRAGLVILRQFLSVGEPIQLNAMYTFALAHINDVAARSDIGNAYTVWKKISKRSNLMVVYKDQEVTPDAVKELFFSYEFHSDNVEANKLIEGLPPFMLATYRYHFLNFLEDALFHIGHLRQWIDHALSNDLITEVPRAWASVSTNEREEGSALVEG